MPCVVVGLLVGACGGSSTATPSPGDGDRPLVVATTGIWADVVGQVACDERVEVRALIPDGADPHGFEPSLADRAALEAADLVVANGLSLEESLDDPLTTVEADGTPVLRLGPLVETVAYRAGGHDDHADDGDPDEVDGDQGDDHDRDEAAGPNPHIWFDPLRVAAVLAPLGDALVDEVGLDRARIDACVDHYRSVLEDLDREVGERVAGLPAESRLLVTNHESLGYYADRYGFAVVGSVSPAPSGLAEANPAHLRDLADRMDRSGVRVVFAETGNPSDEADALAGLVDGAEVVSLPIESLGPLGSPSDSYVGLVRTVNDLIVEALGG